MNPNLKKRIESINKGIIPEGYKKTKVGIVPVEWEVVKLADIGKSYIGLTYSPEDTANNGLIVLRSSNIKNNKIDLSDCVYVKCEVSDKNRVRTNDILICARNGSSSLIGKSALILSEYADFAFGAFMSVYRTQYFKYTFQVFQSFIIKKQILRNLGARINQITTADLNLFRIPFPPLPEQQKIAEILSTQDKLIELQERKINQLKTLKKGYLQKMFPKKGSKYPELRFKGFTDPWEQREVKELCSISTGKSNTQDKINEGEYPFYVRSPIVERSNKYLYDEEAVLTVGDGVGTGKVFHYVNGKYDLHQRCYRMYAFSDELNAKYFYHTFSHLFYKRVMAMTAKTSVDSVRLEMISDMEIPTPTIAEQEKVGAFFTNLDNLITLHQRKLDEEKQKKKALMQLLLTGKVRCI